MKQASKVTNNGVKQRENSLYRSVADALRRQLSDGNLSAGQKVPSLRALAKEFKVSTITVNQALRILHQDGLVTYIPAVGAFVRRPETEDQPRTQNCIAFATIDFESTFTGRVATGIEEACRKRGWALQIYSADCQPAIEAQVLERMPVAGIKGAVMVITGDTANLEAIFKLKLEGFPFVLVDRWIPGLKVDVVESDHENGAYLATQHLIAHGFRNIHMLSCPPGLMSSVDSRWSGYERALLENGIEPQREWRVICEGDHHGKEGYWTKWTEAAAPVLEKLKQRKEPVAFVTVNPCAAKGLLECCHNLEMRVPHDVSLVSFDDAEFMHAFQPPITAVAQRTREIGRLAFQLLERRIQLGPTAEPQHIQLEMDLIERRSVRSMNGASRESAPVSLSQAVH